MGVGEGVLVGVLVGLGITVGVGVGLGGTVGVGVVGGVGDGLAIGPMLMGTQKPAHIVTPSTTVRGLLNMTAVAVYDAQVSAAS